MSFVAEIHDRVPVLLNLLIKRQIPALFTSMQIDASRGD